MSRERKQEREDQRERKGEGGREGERERRELASVKGLPHPYDTCAITDVIQSNAINIDT